MVKDEAKNIRKTILSLWNKIDGLVILDTGSTDDTISIIQTICEEIYLPLYLFEEPFVDFSTSRNKMLDFAQEQTSADYILCMDANDELRENDLRGYLSNLENNYNSFLLNLEWKDQDKMCQHKSIRMVKNNGKYRYKYPVHECLCPARDEVENNHEIPEDVLTLYQNRDDDDPEKRNRYGKDVEILLREYNEHPTDTRIVYYLAQSYYFNNQYTDAIVYYKKRLELADIRKNEETLQSYIHIGRCFVYGNNNWEEAMGWFWRAHCYGAFTIDPIIYIAEQFLAEKRSLEAYHLINMVINAEFPNTLKLNVDPISYHFTRHYLMALASYDISKYNEAVTNASVAIKYLQANPTYPNAEKLAADMNNIIKHTGTKYLNKYTRRSTKHTILLFAGWEYKKWNGLSLRNGAGLGGSETSAVLLAELLVRTEDYHVIICCDTEECIYLNGVEYIRIDDFEPFLSQYIVDTLIVQRFITAIRDYLNIGKIIIWLQDQDPAGGAFAADNPKLKAVVPLTNFHKDYLATMTPEAYQYLLQPIGNAILTERFNATVTKEKLRFIYSSCPSRGLSRTLKIFNKIKEKYPIAQLHIFSNFNNDYVRKKADVPTLLAEVDSSNGVHNRGRVSQDQLAREMQLSEYWLYPTHFEETYCITGLEVQCAGCICIYTAVGSLPEVIGNRGICIKTDEEALKAIDEFENNPKKKVKYRKRGIAWAKKQTYQNRVKDWIKLLS